MLLAERVLIGGPGAGVTVTPAGTGVALVYGDI